ncbi:hypothetical protein GCM10027290_55720 [Micromonospora sonneratiae]|uniref:DUF4386 family protein n=1 Tax=Micromonospora sonneratiae TaxID=1184706 RepID=A0ABW3YH09_9ACTN
MSDQTNTPSNNPTASELLASVDALRRDARTARHAYWFPLLLFGLLTVIAAPLYVESVDPAPMRVPRENHILTGLGGQFLEHSASLGWYWLVALIGGYVASLGFYRFHARRVGVQTPTRGYLIAGIVGIPLGLTLPIMLDFLLLNAATSVSEATSWLTGRLLSISDRGMFPHLIIVVGLVVLARLERSRGLSIVVAGYAAAVLLVNGYFFLADFGSGGLNRFGFMVAALLPAPVLLVGGAVALGWARNNNLGRARNQKA